MNLKLVTVIILFFSIVLQSFQCGRPIDPNCTNRTQDTVLLNSTIINSKAVYHIGDTVWIGSIVSDNLTPLSGAAAFNIEFTQLFLTIQPYSIKTNPTLPELQYANIEFNPVVSEGQLQSNGYGGYNFLYKRTTGSNSLKVGFIAGRTGLYAMDCVNDRYYYNGGSNFAIYKPNDYCNTYWGITNFSPVVQNRNYWDSIGVTAVSLAPNYGSVTISKNERNYFLFKVIP